jgi:hypothetical protein
MSEYTQNLEFADALLQLGVPKMLTSLDALELYTSGAHYVLDWAPDGLMSSAPVKAWTKFVLRQAMRDATVIVAPVHELDGFGAEELAGKTIVTSTVNDGRIAQFRKERQHGGDGAPAMSTTCWARPLDAMIIAATEKGDEILEDDYLEIINLELEPRIIYPNGFKRASRFAFVIHRYRGVARERQPIGCLQVSPPIFMDTLEKAMAYLPPFVYSKVTGIRSPTGVEAEGWLISVGGTPREIMSRDPEFTYRRLLEAAKIAKQLGAQIMGLGAFTKVVGDAGATVARRAPLPITTGNSYSASGALWAAHDAVLRLGLVPTGARAEVQFKAMVVERHRRDRSVWRPPAGNGRRGGLSGVPNSPAAALRDRSEGDPTPGCSCPRARQGHRRHGHDRDCDLGGQKVLDIMKVKPGA